jgi:hypothetical protein
VDDEIRIIELARKTGLTEHEARILDHIQQATDLYEELYEEDPEDEGIDTNTWAENQNGLTMLLMWRVLRRDYPDGWGTGSEELEEEDDADGY